MRARVKRLPAQPKSLITLNALSSVVCLALSLWVTSAATAKVRPSDISYPTNNEKLGRGYDVPGAIFDLSLWGGAGGPADTEQTRSVVGLLFEARSPFPSGELGFRLGMFNHQFELDGEEDRGVYSSNLSLDWRWRGGERGPHDPFIGVGVALPTRKLSGEGGLEGESQLDAQRIGLASRFGGFDRWMWEPNSAAAFVEMGGRSRWGGFFVEGELAISYLYRVADSTEIEPGNLFAQAGAGLGVGGDVWTVSLGGGYAITPLSLAGDVDQIHGRAQVIYAPQTLNYYVALFAPIDAPMGVLDGSFGWSLTLGMMGQL